MSDMECLLMSEEQKCKKKANFATLCVSRQECVPLLGSGPQTHLIPTAKAKDNVYTDILESTNTHTCVNTYIYCIVCTLSVGLCHCNWLLTQAVFLSLKLTSIFTCNKHYSTTFSSCHRNWNVEQWKQTIITLWNVRVLLVELTKTSRLTLTQSSSKGVEMSYTQNV